MTSEPIAISQVSCATLLKLIAQVLVQVDSFPPELRGSDQTLAVLDILIMDSPALDRIPGLTPEDRQQVLDLYVIASDRC